MEKEGQPESLTDVTVKQYAPSEVYSSEPPPAYHRPQSASVQIARIAAITVVAVSIVLGGFILAAAYVNANASCQQLQQELLLLQEAADRMQPLQPEALVQEEPHHRLRSTETHAEQKEEQKDQNINDKEVEDNNISQESQESEESSEEDDEDRTPIHIKLPLQLDFDELAGALMEKNQKARMNCIVERKKAEEVVDHQAKTVSLPFGLNLTTDPRYERVTGERMVILCESGEAEQREAPQQEQEETMMVQPIVIPLPGGLHIPVQFQGPMRGQQTEMNPMGLPSPVRTHTIIMEQLPQRPPVPVQQALRPQANELPPHPLMQHIAQQIIAQHEMAAQRQQEIMAQRQQQEMAQRRQQEFAQRQQQEIAQKRQQEFIQRHQQEMIHRHQQEMLQRQHQLIQRQQEMAHQQELARQRSQQEEQAPQHVVQETIMMPHHIPMPEEILSQINRLPNREVMVSVSEHEAEEVPQENVRVVQHPRESAQEMNGRQSYARGLPVHIPVPMMQQVQEAPQQEESARPHYVQPRSVRSVDALLRREKRVKRCACDCAC